MGRPSTGTRPSVIDRFGGTTPVSKPIEPTRQIQAVQQETAPQKIKSEEPVARAVAVTTEEAEHKEKLKVQAANTATNKYAKEKAMAAARAKLAARKK